jgi:Uma2 family endonuclease
MVPAPNSAHAKLERRVGRLLEGPAQAAGLDVAGPINIGSAEDYRIPDAALLRPGPDAVYLPTAALVLEVVSPDDQTWAKLPFYGAHAVDELLIVDPQGRSVRWLALRGGDCAPVAHSELLGVDVERFAAQIDWP